MTDIAIPATKAIVGRVAAILNARELAINVGSDAGVKRAMKFAVLSEKPLEIKDPETQETLDVFDREKIRVEAVEVRPHVTICRTFRTKTVGGGPLSDLHGWMTAPRKEVTETLKAQDEAFPPPLSAEQSFVKIKDRVVQVIE
jgi:hypothetical protein